jgi:hypothetical protein
MNAVPARDRIDAERLRALLAYDPATGVFRWRVHRGNRIRAGAIAGTRDGRGRLRICLDRRTLHAHRLAWLWMTGHWPTQIDHINRNPSDNSWANLREEPQAVNCRNKKMPKSNTSGSTGVYALGNGTYRATICVNYRTLHLGVFQNFDEAVAARRAAQVRYGFSPGHGTPRRRPIHRRPIHTPRLVQLDLYGQVGAP